jgi:hypothetical protein
VLPSGQKVTSGVLATITLEIVPFCSYTPLPLLLSLFKCILEGVQRHLQFCPNHLICVKMAAFEFYLQSGETRVSCRGPRQVSRVGANDSHVVCGEKEVWGGALL